jgi:quercetin dioxygenase-like cupin family protein
MSEEGHDEQIWANSLDAMTAAPDHHEILLENDLVRVLDARVQAGDATPIHTHRWPAVFYILGVSDFIRYDAEGNAVFDSREAESGLQIGQTVWSPPLTPHFVKNIGNAEIRVISIEIKKDRI